MGAWTLAPPVCGQDYTQKEGDLEQESSTLAAAG